MVAMGNQERVPNSEKRPYTGQRPDKVLPGNARRSHSPKPGTRSPCGLLGQADQSLQIHWLLKLEDLEDYRMIFTKVPFMIYNSDPGALQETNEKGNGLLVASGMSRIRRFKGLMSATRQTLALPTVLTAHDLRRIGLFRGSGNHPGAILH